MLDLVFHGDGDEPYTRYNRDAQLANQDRAEYVGCIKYPLELLKIIFAPNIKIN